MMFTTSRVTAVAAHDPTLGDVHDLASCIWVLAATHGDGTLFSQDSFQEEDLVELCMDLGQPHPDGVLQISETKALFTFQITAKMMATTQLLGVAMAWCDEPIRLCTHHPTNTYIRDYAADRGTCPGTQTLTPGREVVFQFPLVTPTLKRSLCLNS